jgi:hypothetical protein
VLPGRHGPVTLPRTVPRPPRSRPHPHQLPARVPHPHVPVGGRPTAIRRSTCLGRRSGYCSGHPTSCTTRQSRAARGSHWGPGGPP